ncbi:MAG: hypothetical protein ACE5SW_08280 [Nitrososphaeraceae archaeon]
MGLFRRVSFIALVSLFGCYILSSSGILIQDSFSHGLFNSAGQRIGKFYVQIATDPEIPTTGKDAKILLRISTDEDVEVTDIPITITITKNGMEVDHLPQIVVTNGHHEFDYKFPEAGNYVFYIDLMDLYFTGKTIKYTFNLSTHNPFGYIFYSLISFAVATPLVIIAIIFVTNKRRAARIARNHNQNSTETL